MDQGQIYHAGLLEKATVSDELQHLKLMDLPNPVTLNSSINLKSKGITSLYSSNTSGQILLLTVHFVKTVFR